MVKQTSKRKECNQTKYFALLDLFYISLNNERTVICWGKKIFITKLFLYFFVLTLLFLALLLCVKNDIELSCVWFGSFERAYIHQFYMVLSCLLWCNINEKITTATDKSRRSWFVGGVKL